MWVVRTKDGVGVASLSLCLPETSCVNEEKIEKEAIEIVLSSKEQTVNDLNLESYLVPDDTELLFLIPEEVEHKLKQEDEASGDLVGAFRTNSDLVPNVYEGGLKLWECSYDLVHFLCDNKTEFKETTVLELGCGGGLPGLYAMKKGANIHFQDYNSEVIKHMTIPNVAANSPDTVTDLNCRFFSGDWGSLQALLGSEEKQTKYDMILTSETIYNPDSYMKLHNLFKATLKANGVIYVAAKTCYFGVGGGTRLFETLLDKEAVFQYKTVKKIQKGVHREILELKFNINNEIT